MHLYTINEIRKYLTLHTISIVRVWEYAWGLDDGLLPPLWYVIIVVAFVSHNHTHPAHMHDHTRYLVENNIIIQGSKGGRETLLAAAQGGLVS